MISPYAGVPDADWNAKTEELIREFPLSEPDVVTLVLDAWNSILQTRIGAAGYQIGKDIFPQPQIMGFFLHELIPLELEHRYPTVWSRDFTGYGKDIICKTNSLFSCEIKTSSDKYHIFANRSHAQLRSSSKKDKSGYYLAINFGKFVLAASGKMPVINRIRLGWLDDADWHPQKAPTGQQAKLLPAVEKNKLKVLYSLK